MQKNIWRGAWLAAFLALASGALIPSPALAQAKAAPRPAAAPVVDGLEVNADAGLTPGSTLDFTVRGTPKAIARVQVAGTGVALPLRESAPGVYTGQYTVKRNERGLQASSLIRAQLTTSGRTTTSTFSFPSSFAAAPAAGPQPGVAAQGGVRIDRFASIPVDRLDPGTELKFALEGTPGGKASVQVPGLMLTIPMLEQRPGHYAGSYTLRRVDTVGPGPVVATLRARERTVTANLAGPLTATASAAGTSAPQPAGTLGAAAASALSLQVTSPGPNAAIDAGSVVVQGRTAPGASVHAKVDAIPPAAAGRVAVAQQVTEQTVQADANGQFSLNFGPQRFLPGTRFEVGLSARQGLQTTPEQRLVLFQRG